MNSGTSEGTRISVDFSSKVDGTKKLEDYAKQLQKIYTLLSAIDGGKKGLKGAKTEVDKISKSTDKANKDVDKMAKKFNIGFNIKSIAEVSRKIISLSGNIKKLTDQYSAYIENVNLLEVAYSRQSDGLSDYNTQVKENSKNVKELIDQMSRVYGFDESRLTRQFGIFKQLSNAMKLPADTAEELSEHMVKMTNDIASLYNLPLDRASNALQSALAGQVRPIRSATGADITEKTLQQTVDALGLDRSISQLSYVEKRLIMVISLTEQLKKSQGDYGRTIESVSNQTRVLKEQWERVKRSVGEIAYPLVKIILPYVNAILMVVAKIADLVANIVASWLHVNLEEEFDYNSMAGASDAVNDLIDGMDEAGNSADKLKDKMNGLRGFDKLNVIGDTKSADVSTGIDPRILDAFSTSFSSYSDELDKIQMKATKIADAIWEWLKGTDGSYTNLKFVGIMLGTIAGFNIIKGVKNLISVVKKLKEKVGTSKSAGLLGSLSTLAHLLGAIAIVWEIVIIAKNIGNIIKESKELKKSMETLNEVNESNKKSTERLEEAMKKLPIEKMDEATKLYTNSLAKQNANALEVIATNEKHRGGLYSLIGVSKKYREQSDIVIDGLKQTTDQFRKLYEQGKLDEEGTRQFTDALDKQISAMDLLGQDTSELRDEYEKLTGKKWEATLTASLKDELSHPFQTAMDNISWAWNETKKQWEGESWLSQWWSGFKNMWKADTWKEMKANGGIFANGQWHDVASYATGTTSAPVGQMFLAREAGPELVGTIGNHTAVMNNDQIVASVSDGVYRAVKMANSGGSSQGTQVFHIYLDENHKIGTYTLEQLQGMAKTNGKPITIKG